jgi:two-component system, NarL family, nitrate/nitrite response regulator NarL
MALDQNIGQETIRVLVADNTRMHTQLLAEALRRDRRLEVIGSASHSRDLLEAVTTHKIHVVVLASNLDEEPGRGLEVLRELRNSHPDTHAVILLDSSKREAVVEAFRAGARGLFSRHESLETLSRCVRTVHEGQVWANGQQTLFAVEALASSPTLRTLGASGLSLLSKREVDVVHCLAEGLTNREIAERLGLSQHTIKNYLFRVFDKLGVSSRLELLSLTLSSPGSPAGIPGGSDDPAPVNGRGDHEAGELASHRKAADLGSPAAQFALAQMYRQGNNVAKDLASAYMWCLVSERTNLEMRDEITAAKKQLSEALTTEQIKEAQTRALERLRKFSKAFSSPSSPPSTRGSS